MQVLYTYTNGTTPVYITEGAGVIRLLVLFKDQGDEFVYYCDDYLSKTFINRVKNPLAKDKFNVNNFEAIASDDQFNTYVKFIDNLYNYAGLHKGEQIQGNDINTKIWLPNGS